MSIDEFYTPPELAKKLIEYTTRTPQSVVDFCAGGGELLRACERKWKNITCYATDISKATVGKLKEYHKDWIIDFCDFTDEQSRNSCIILNCKFDLILLNPPFSCKGATRNTIEYNGNVFKVSTSMMFVINALRYMSPNGELFAILPSSTAYSEKDEHVWNALKNDYLIEVLCETRENFSRCTPNVILVSIKHGQTPSEDRIQLLHNIKLVDFFRGKISMNEVVHMAEGDIPFVHTVNLKSSKISTPKLHIQTTTSILNGPALLIPRVGKPDAQKLIVIDNQKRYALSDCIIAIKTLSEQDAYRVKDILLSNWDIVFSLYQGTGAKYITLKKLKSLLEK